MIFLVDTNVFALQVISTRTNKRLSKIIKPDELSMQFARFC